MSVRLEIGDCLEVLPRLRAEGVLADAVVTDSPYHLVTVTKRLGAEGAKAIQHGTDGAFARAAAGFMGQKWDGGDVAFRPDTWKAVMAVMKPGAWLVAFGGPKTSDLLAAALRAAGFEMRDRLWNALSLDELVVRFLESLDAEQRDGFAAVIEQSAFGGELAWMFGSGFPKNKASLKPAHEPILLARKPGPGAGTVLQIDAARIPFASPADEAETKDMNAHAAFGSGPRSNRIYGKFDKDRDDYDAPGRWPANVVHDGSNEVLDGFPDCAPATSRTPSNAKGVTSFGAGNNLTIYRDGTESAARFFYCAKATSGERVYRCRQCGAHRLGKPDCGHRDERGQLDLTSHPTVKPVALLRWLVRLVCPPGGLVLDPFAGTGTTGAAARAEGMDALLIEREPAYAADICVRLGLPMPDMALPKAEARPRHDHGPLFDAGTAA